MNSLNTEMAVIGEENLPKFRLAGFILPLAALFFKPVFEPWLFMWILALSVYCACKWLVLFDAQPPRISLRQNLLFCFVYPGMDAWAFLGGTSQRLHPAGKQILFSLFKVCLGTALFFCAAKVALTHPSVAAWMGMFGIVLFLHFGAFELAALSLQRSGQFAPLMMNKPLQSTSLSEFWGKRWNRDFHILTERYVFKSTRPRLGGRNALLLGFVLSGFVHELVITFPARGGYGGPLAYFLLQGAGVLAERKLRRRGLLRSKPSGWCYTLLFTLAPIGLLFPIEFRERVILPMLKIAGAL